MVVRSSRSDGQEYLADGVATCMSRFTIAARAKRMDKAVSRTTLRDGRSPSVADMAILVSPCESCRSPSAVAASPCATEGAPTIGGEFADPSAVHPTSAAMPGVNAPAVAGDSPLLQAIKLLLTALKRARVHRHIQTKGHRYEVIPKRGSGRFCHAEARMGSTLLDLLVGAPQKLRLAIWATA